MPINNNINNFFQAIEGGNTQDSLLDQGSASLAYGSTQIANDCSYSLTIERTTPTIRGFTPPSENEFALAAIACWGLE